LAQWPLRPFYYERFLRLVVIVTVILCSDSKLGNIVESIGEVFGLRAQLAQGNERVQIANPVDCPADAATL